MLDSVYLAPDAELEAEDYAFLCTLVESTFPYIEQEWGLDLSERYQCPTVMATATYTRVVLLKIMLNRYREVILSSMEDVAELTDTALQLSEMCKAMESIQLQMASICGNVLAVDQAIGKLGNSSADKLTDHIDEQLMQDRLVEQLELDI